ncbi:MAG: hypothetical protein OXD38_05695 [Aestuariivita sp.]|nr:hypothetical protein [Aestuariivita sp.]
MKTKLYRIGALLLLVYAFFLPWPASMGQSGYGGDGTPDSFSGIYRFHEYPLNGAVSIQWQELAVNTFKLEENVYSSYGFVFGEDGVSGDPVLALISDICLNVPDTREVVCAYSVGSTSLVVTYTPETPLREIDFFVNESNFLRFRAPVLSGKLSLVEQF